MNFDNMYNLNGNSIIAFVFLSIIFLEWPKMLNFLDAWTVRPPNLILDFWLKIFRNTSFSSAASGWIHSFVYCIRPDTISSMPYLILDANILDANVCVAHDADRQKCKSGKFFLKKLIVKHDLTHLRVRKARFFLDIQ